MWLEIKVRGMCVLSLLLHRSWDPPSPTYTSSLVLGASEHRPLPTVSDHQYHLHSALTVAQLVMPVKLTFLPTIHCLPNSASVWYEEPTSTAPTNCHALSTSAIGENKVRRRTFPRSVARNSCRFYLRGRTHVDVARHAKNATNGFSRHTSS